MVLAPEVRAGIEWVQDDFDRILATVTPTQLAAPSVGTRWTNGQLLFHMWFGQRIARAFLIVIGGFARLPPGASRGWARLLTVATRPYSWINYAASAVGGRFVPLATTRRWMHQDTAAILRWADRASEAELGRGMSVPPGWDPYFTSWMDRADLLAWAPKHYRHHRAQLSIEGLPA